MRLSDAKAIVTGAASGMGRHFVRRLAEAGAHVHAVDVDAAGLGTLHHELSAAGFGAHVSTATCDVSKEDEVVATVAGARDTMRGLNVLINSAGIFRDGLLVKRDKNTGAVQKMSLGTWQKVIDVDLTGPFLMTREFAAAIVESGDAESVVVNLSSVSRHGNIGQSNYSAAKAGLVADTKLWGLELARYGIRVGAIAPGFIRTPILEGMPPAALERMVSGVPLQRVGEPEEIWLGVKFIVECGYFTGRCLDIDGGVTI
ncbi:MAG: SDR family oxidoreductase [Myxococcales bacterium]|nr:SDR family oxidoreductase [Myxococcales bacterium]MCB9530875.1 SDR family oxidoreductase [Myxococcales bacterium]MCB9534331.1 SDR family oxidoreductase [Myxococcales bacterium]